MVQRDDLSKFSLETERKRVNLSNISKGVKEQLKTVRLWKLLEQCKPFELESSIINLISK